VGDFENGNVKDEPIEAFGDFAFVGISNAVFPFIARRTFADVGTVRILASPTIPTGILIK